MALRVLPFSFSLSSSVPSALASSYRSGIALLGISKMDKGIGIYGLLISVNYIGDRKASNIVKTPMPGETYELN